MKNKQLIAILNDTYKTQDPYQWIISDSLMVTYDTGEWLSFIGELVPTKPSNAGQIVSMVMAESTREAKRKDGVMLLKCAEIYEGGEAADLQAQYPGEYDGIMGPEAMVAVFHGFYDGNVVLFDRVLTPAEWDEIQSRSESYLFEFEAKTGKPLWGQQEVKRPMPPKEDIKFYSKFSRVAEFDEVMGHFAVFFDDNPQNATMAAWTPEDGWNVWFEDETESWDITDPKAPLEELFYAQEPKEEVEIVEVKKFERDAIFPTQYVAIFSDGSSEEIGKKAYEAIQCQLS